MDGAMMPGRVCEVAGCGRPHLARGLCRMHYSRARRGAPATLPSEEPHETPPYGVYGVLEDDGDRVMCHECGVWLRALGGHLVVHGETAVEYRARWGLPRGRGLVSASLSAVQSANATAQIGTAGWARLEAARDPTAAAHSRDEAALRAAGAAQQQHGRDLSAANLGSGRVRVCPVCGREYIGQRGRGDLCGSVECARTVSAQAARRSMADRYRPLTDTERAEIAALPATTEALDATVLRLRGDGVPLSEIAAVLGVSLSWVSRRWPTRERMNGPHP